MGEFTPGPWEIYSGPESFVVDAEFKDLIADCTPELYSNISYVESEANARLIAAAPDLLAACEALSCYPSDHWSDAVEYEDYVLTPYEIAMYEARKAIAKAKGNKDG